MMFLYLGRPKSCLTVFTGDGCLMEGVASEASSLAGHLQLGNLIVVSNKASIGLGGS
jgi:transketolase